MPDTTTQSLLGGSATAIALLISIAGAAGTVLGATVAPIVNYMVNERQMDVKMVEIGIGILRAPPAEDIAVIRSWAIDIIEKSSRQKFDAAQRAALLKKELPFSPGFSPGFGYSYGTSSGYGSGETTNKAVQDRYLPSPTAPTDTPPPPH